MKKLTVLVIGAAGYVLGARAGRERYEQIKRQATKAWNNPTVQSAVDDVQTQAKQAGSEMGSKVGSKVADVAGEAKSKIADKMHGHDIDPASDNYQPGDEVIGPPPVPGGSRIADASRQGQS
ncbi:YtxH domain-containing protein [Aeromicrobium ginsengisoli]|uniref:YtxH domain-containing protein n=1 Tax=Aeromicrobium ginsengisoli TaxID=363867 RepID=A0A5M4FBI3_9ACTN|nr:YtxH domain-containing protein [Aeromicrobium ginsengisoli]KAA1395733.1 YtxH domain-containing protein [Aeromicrobium ginsengisoli]